MGIFECKKAVDAEGGAEASRYLSQRLLLGPNQVLRTTKPLALKEALKVAPSNVNDYLDTFCGADLSVQKDKKAIGAESGAENCWKKKPNSVLQK